MCTRSIQFDVIKRCEKSRRRRRRRHPILINHSVNRCNLASTGPTTYVMFAFRVFVLRAVEIANNARHQLPNCQETEFCFHFHGNIVILMQGRWERERERELELAAIATIGRVKMWIWFTMIGQKWRDKPFYTAFYRSTRHARYRHTQIVHKLVPFSARCVVIKQQKEEEMKTRRRRRKKKYDSPPLCFVSFRW